MDRGNLGTQAHFSSLGRYARTMGPPECRPPRGRTKEQNHAIRHSKIFTSITALHKEAPDMLAADRDILGDAPPERLTQHPAGLEHWVKETKAIVKQSKAAGCP
jgi:hypothetical protein